VRDRLLAISAPEPAGACVDLGAGTGFVSLALAPLADSVLAVDISSAMAESLAARAAQAGLRNIRTQVADLRTFQLPAASVDLVVSNYALHHLRDQDKRELAGEAARWLRPGGRIVIADMMFGRGTTKRDRQILRDKVRALAAMGPGGWWRIAKNLLRYGLGVGSEHPATPEFWQQALRDSGFADVRFEPVVAEAGIVSGTRGAAAPCPRRTGREALPEPGRGVPARRRLAVVLGAIVFCALVGGGVAGAVRYGDAFWLYRGFPPPSAPQSIIVHDAGTTRRVPVILPTVQSIVVRSRALGGYPDQVDVVLPPGYASHPAQRYPVLYLLHGFPGQPSQFLNVGQVATTEATLIAAGRIKPMILVIPSGTRLLLADEEWANGISPGNAWETFIARDLVKVIDATYRTVPGGGARGIAGLSEGAYGAVNIGLHHPGEFGLLESWSGYMVADNMPAIFGRSPGALAYNSPATWIRAVASEVRASRTYIWFYCGASDSLARQNRSFAAELRALGIAHRFFVIPGTHSWRLWRGQMPQALITASARLSHG